MSAQEANVHGSSPIVDLADETVIVPFDVKDCSVVGNEINGISKNHSYLGRAFPCYCFRQLIPVIQRAAGPWVAFAELDKDASLDDSHLVYYSHSQIGSKEVLPRPRCGDMLSVFREARMMR
jgi:hypothetical protein